LLSTLRDCFQHIARLGNVGQIDLGFDLVLGSRRTCGARSARLRRFLLATKVDPNLFRLIAFERTGMRLLLGNAEGQEHV
jgi:hypothetical protein